MQKSLFIHYHEGTDKFDALEDLSEEDQARLQLKPMDEKTKKRLEKIQGAQLFALLPLALSFFFQQDCLQ